MRYTADGRRWLLISEAVYQSGRSESTVRQRVKEGRMEHRTMGGQLYVSQLSVDQLWEEKRGPWKPLFKPPLKGK